MTELLLDRVLDRISIDDQTGCWLWTGYGAAGGYGRVGYKGRQLSAHRVIYEELVEPIPDGLILDHLCHSDDPTCNLGHNCPHRRCVNPDHLEPVTNLENVRRGRSPAAVIFRGDVCPKGHPYTPNNTYRRPGRNFRECRACRTEPVRRVQRKQRQTRA